MSRTKITILGKLRFSEDGGLQYSVSLTQAPSVPESILVYSPTLIDPSELTDGDLLVLVTGDLCRYRGHSKVVGAADDDLDIEFAGGVHRSVPVYMIDLLRKYEGVGGKLLTLGSPKQRTPITYWLEALSDAYDWPGIGQFPEYPQLPAKVVPKERYEADERNVIQLTPEMAVKVSPKESYEAEKAAWKEWRRACDSYMQTLHADPSYRQAAREFLERQRREPELLRDTWWAYRDKILGVESTEPESLRDKETDAIQVKHYVLRRERQDEKIRREVEALENLEKVESSAREPIPESVRLFVWQRDKGQCVKCGSRERLEFDHIIPLIAGGSNTERNVQLLCESCNRSKGSTI